MTNFDQIIIGGGAAGIMAAISAKKNNPISQVAIIDRTFALGRKILVAGAGRCNITNVNLADLDSIGKHYYTSNSENLELIKKVFSNFGYSDIINFFDELGVETYIERKTNIGKVFPITDSAKTITYLLEKELEKLDIKIILNTEVISAKRIDSKFQLETKLIENLKDDSGRNLVIDNSKIVQVFTCDKLILSAGGKTYPALGSNGSGFLVANSFGHKVIEPVPSALPLVSSIKICKLLSGQKMDMIATSVINGKIIKSRFDDVMFTDYGLSGPAILNISREISIRLNRKSEARSDVKVILNFLVHQNGESYTLVEFEKRIERRKEDYLETALVGIFPNKIASVLAHELGNSKCEELLSNRNKLENIFDKLQNFEFDITATRSWNEAEFTAGGVDLNEVKETLESKLVENLYFAGEILDVDGDVGGYNLSWAWSSGFIAGDE